MSVSSGQCLCGAVKMQGKGAPDIGSCHCEMCRRWHGGPAVSVRFEGGIEITEGKANVGWYQSSEWAERGFCKTCGSTLFYRTLDGAYWIGETGSFDLPEGLKVNRHYFIDQKPDYYDVKDDAQKLTGAEVMAMFASDGAE
jgi:hypothetical protein